MRKSPSISGTNISFPRMAANKGTPMLSTSGTSRTDPMSLAFALRVNVKPRTFVNRLHALIQQRVVAKRAKWHDVVSFDIVCEGAHCGHKARNTGIFCRHYYAQQIVVPNFNVL